MTTTLTTITGRVIKVTPNKSARTFTLRTDVGKYRTNRMIKEEFESSLNNTGNDWQHFLNGGNYYKVK